MTWLVRLCAGALLFLALPDVRADDEPAPTPKKESDKEATPELEEGKEKAEKKEKKKTKELPEDPYLSNYKKFEHREERQAGRGPQGRKLGFGLSLGRPVSLAGKLYFTQTIAVDFDLGATYSFQGPEVDFTGHLLWHITNLLIRDEFKLSVYIGGGGRFGLWPILLTGNPNNIIPVCTSTSLTQPTLSLGGCTRYGVTYLPNAESFPGTLGVQGLAGLSLFLQNYPVELYAQPIGTLELFPTISVDFGAQVGFRYYIF